jgi:DNA mismatch repair ATPase MutS
MDPQAHLEEILAHPLHTPFPERRYSIVAEDKHRNLLPLSEERYFSRRKKEENIDHLFIQALNIPTILQKLFSFKNSKTYQTAIDIIKEVDITQNQLRYEREEFLRSLMENENLDQISQLFSEYHNLEGQRNYNNPEEPPRHEIRRKHPLLKRQLEVLEEMIELTSGTPIEELQTQVDRVRKSDWFQKLEEGKIKRKIYDEYELLQEIGDALSKHISDTLDYFIGFAEGFDRLKKDGTSMVFAELVNLRGYKYCNIQGGINPILHVGANADKEKVPNDFFTDEMSSVRVVTGENEYGKTVAIKTRGIIQAFAQAGLPVIAERAVLTPVDKILANIGLTEDTVEGRSTYRNINETTFKIVDAATRKSLVILDEPTSGTYDLKAIRQGEVYIREMANAGYEAWVVTHHLELTSLAEEVPEIENLTTMVKEGKPTYKLAPGVFVPNDDNVNLEYPLEAVQAATASRSSRKIKGGHEQFPNGKALTRLEIYESNQLPEHLREPLKEYLDQQEVSVVKND